MVLFFPKKDTSLWVKNQGKLTTSNASTVLFGHALAVSSDSLTLSPKNSKIISGRSGTLFIPIICHYSFRTTCEFRFNNRDADLDDLVFNLYKTYFSN